MVQENSFQFSHRPPVTLLQLHSGSFLQHQLLKHCYNCGLSSISRWPLYLHSIITIRSLEITHSFLNCHFLQKFNKFIWCTINNTHSRVVPSDPQCHLVLLTSYIMSNLSLISISEHRPNSISCINSMNSTRPANRQKIPPSLK